MIFLANRANLDKRTLLTRLHNHLQTRVPKEHSPINHVRYHTSAGNKVGVRATIDAEVFLQSNYPVDEAELHVSFDLPPKRSYEFYTIQWVESERNLMLGWHQDETHQDLGACHVQIDYRGETVQRDEAAFLDSHPLNVFDERTDQFLEILKSITWENDRPTVPERAVQ